MIERGSTVVFRGAKAVFFRIFRGAKDDNNFPIPSYLPAETN
ncbi:hypothetical protein Pla52o_02290 [Novipirellula galeiformis]|uniref:Uncharacterized protein n=1 Tax=Novipirellula galeiformis TaxID=2528004 RepID=A0A5C6CTK8_9BACT|nr:hypothetical protein Pla52o_02290 [Novipirellula galeiformis]